MMQTITTNKELFKIFRDTPFAAQGVTYDNFRFQRVEVIQEGVEVTYKKAKILIPINFEMPIGNVIAVLASFFKTTGVVISCDSFGNIKTISMQNKKIKSTTHVWSFEDRKMIIANQKGKSAFDIVHTYDSKAQMIIEALHIFMILS